MKAVIQKQFGGADVLQVVEDYPKPELKPRDVLVNNKAFALNPIDYKVRDGLDGSTHDFEKQALVVGWDAAGIIEAIGSDVKGFSVGDEVYYAGDLTRPGSYAEYTAVDERLIAFKPKTLSFNEAATVPLTAQTAYEAMYEKQNIKAGQTILIYNGAGGVGSIAIQLAKARGLTVIATASRPETIEWVKKQGADHVVNHREDIAPQLEKIGIPAIDHLFHLYDNKNLGALLKLLKPMGSVAMIWPLEEAVMKEIDFSTCWLKSITFYHELMYTRSMFDVDQEGVNRLLTDVAKMIDEGKLRHTMTKTYEMKDIAEAHRMLEKSQAVGKISVTV